MLVAQHFQRCNLYRYCRWRGYLNRSFLISARQNSTPLFHTQNEFHFAFLATGSALTPSIHA
jgi:hypothetical protein